MRWCQSHWDGLRAEVKRQGLSALVPDSGEKAAGITAPGVVDVLRCIARRMLWGGAA